MSTYEKKNLIVYHFFEKDQAYIKNLAHFFVFGYCTKNDYIIIVAGDYSIDFPSAPNITYLFTPNLNHDYGGYCHMFSMFNQWSQYERIIFVNSSVRGPFKTIYTQSTWTELFTDKIREDVGMAGSTINILPEYSSQSSIYKSVYGETTNLTHIQTTAFAISNELLAKVLSIGLFSEFNILSKEYVIAKFEIGLSQFALNLGYNIKCLLPEYNKIDYRFPHTEINPTSLEGDLLFKNAYFGRTIHPFESLFIKTNRSLWDENYLDALASSMYASYFDTNQLRSSFIDVYLHHITNRFN